MVINIIILFRENNAVNLNDPKVKRKGGCLYLS